MNILVIGETCIDEYVYGMSERICPEAPVPCFKTNGVTSSTLGMASNVRANIEALSNYNVDIITNDIYPIKRRFIDTRYNHIVFREDRNDICCRSNLTTLDTDDYDAVVISDYNKGFLTEDDISTIIDMSKDSLVFIDTKKIITNFIDGVNFLKINYNEYKNNISNINKIISYCEDGVIVTNGSHGCIYYKYPNIKKTFAGKKVDVSDVCGAGDTFLAGLVVKFLQSKNIDDSIKFANECAAEVVKKNGVVTP